MSRNPYVGPRAESWSWHQLTLAGGDVGPLKGVEGGRFNFSVDAEVRSGGSLTWSGLAVPDWMQMRIQPIYTARTPDGTITRPVGVFIPSSPKVVYTETGVSCEVDLYDKLLLLAQRSTTQTTGYLKGDRFVTAIIKEIISTVVPGTQLAVTDSAEKLRSTTIWDAGTSYLRVVNDLLKAIGYFSLSASESGSYRASPYVSPLARPSAWDFIDDELGLYLPDFTRETDAYDVPNQVTLVARGDGESDPMTATAENWGTGPFSIPSREGEVISVTENDVEATSQAVLQALAERRLGELSRVSQTTEIGYPILPIALNDRVTMRHSSGIDSTAVIQGYSFTTEVGAIVSARLQELA